MSKRMSTQRVVAGVLMTAVALGGAYLRWKGSKSKAGDSCSGQVGACADERNALFCDGGKLAPFPCRGPNGCNGKDDKIFCDMSRNLEGDPCWKLQQVGPNSFLTGQEGSGQCRDDNVLVQCRQGTIRHVTCGGPGGCTQTGDMFQCDQSKGAVVGAACFGSGIACSDDSLHAYECKDGTFVHRSACRGPERCSEKGGQVFCDSSRGDVGDPCAGADFASCSVDGKAMLDCKDGKLSMADPCRGPLGCHVEDDRVHCDMSVADPGDACDGDVGACTADRRGYLECQSGKFALTRRCQECKLAEGQVVCEGATLAR
jgi:hypothetical protein